MLFAVALAGCGRDGSAATLDAPIQLAPGESAVFKAEKLQVTFVDVVSDSRCAADVTCVWQGAVTVRLLIRSDSKETQHELTESQSVAVDGYTVALLATLPERGPESRRIAPTDYRVTLKVSR
jgi:hypothetical protein